MNEIWQHQSAWPYEGPVHTKCFRFSITNKLLRGILSYPIHMCSVALRHMWAVNWVPASHAAEAGMWHLGRPRVYSEAVYTKIWTNYILWFPSPPHARDRLEVNRGATGRKQDINFSAVWWLLSSKWKKQRAEDRTRKGLALWSWSLFLVVLLSSVALELL